LAAFLGMEALVNRVAAKILIMIEGSGQSMF
jgi:hypothetical protein